MAWVCFRRFLTARGLFCFKKERFDHEQRNFAKSIGLLEDENQRF